MATNGAMTGILPGRLIAWWIATRAALTAAGFAAPLLVTQLGQGFPQAVGPPILAMWARYDGNHYVLIAQQGYAHPVSPAFFPLYPLLMQVLTLGSTDRAVLAAAGLIISNAALLVALAYIIALARLDFDEAVGRRVATFYLVAPTTLFLSAVYSESLFLAMAVGSFYHARKGEFAKAALLGFLTGLTRSYGALMALPIAIEAMRRRRWPVAAAAPLLAVPVYFAWLWLQTGNVLAWFHAESHWDRRLTVPGLGFLDYIEPGRWHLFANTRGVIDLVAMIALIVMAVLAARRLPLSYAALAASMTLLFAMAAYFQSVSRWGLTVFPAFFLAGVLVRNRWLQYALIAVSFVLALYAMARFARIQWVA